MSETITFKRSVCNLIHILFEEKKEKNKNAIIAFMFIYALMPFFHGKTSVYNMGSLFNYITFLLILTLCSQSTYLKVCTKGHLQPFTPKVRLIGYTLFFYLEAIGLFFLNLLCGMTVSVVMLITKPDVYKIDAANLLSLRYIAMSLIVYLAWIIAVHGVFTLIYTMLHCEKYFFILMSAVGFLFTIIFKFNNPDLSLMITRTIAHFFYNEIISMPLYIPGYLILGYFISGIIFITMSLFLTRFTRIYTEDKNRHVTVLYLGIMFITIFIIELFVSLLANRSDDRVTLDPLNENITDEIARGSIIVRDEIISTNDDIYAHQLIKFNDTLFNYDYNIMDVGNAMSCNVIDEDVQLEDNEILVRIAARQDTEDGGISINRQALDNLDISFSEPDQMIHIEPDKCVLVNYNLSPMNADAIYMYSTNKSLSQHFPDNFCVYIITNHYEMED